ncbi:TIGR03643 family protein [Flavobacterium sp.]|uniref:TIGR03643 family protein n=1 Tax=Flavobacterium sp. TaxID=239 RepID=UPI003D0FFF81
MRKTKIAELDRETLERLISMAQEERKPFEAIKEEFGIGETEVTEFMRKQLTKEKFELWKKKVTATKPKPKPVKQEDFDEDLDGKYYLKNKF